MVDAIKGRSAVNGSPNGSPAPKQSTLRASFENLSSGLKVAEAVAKDQFIASRKAEAGTADKPAKVDKKVDRALNSLKDAVSLSSQVLDHLDQVSSDEVENPEAHDPIRELAKDLDQVRHDVSLILQQLRERHDRAQVLKENIDSSESAPEDLSAAQARAQNIGLQVVEGDSSLVDAHDISPDRVAALLAD
jgi:vacuolar-type H+-ATPase subunit I/STV1